MTEYKKVTRKSRDSQTKSVGIRLRRDKKIPVYNTKVNWDNKRKPFKMWIVKHPEGSDVVKGSVTIVMAEHYGQAIDDYITIWNKENRMNRKIGYPVVQGTADKNFRYKKDTVRKARGYNLSNLQVKSKKEVRRLIVTRNFLNYYVEDLPEAKEVRDSVNRLMNELKVLDLTIEKILTKALENKVE